LLASLILALVYGRKTPITAADLLNDRVIPVVLRPVLVRIEAPPLQGPIESK
jgi:hypothetical protein